MYIRETYAKEQVINLKNDLNRKVSAIKRRQVLGTNNILKGALPAPRFIKHIHTHALMGERATSKEIQKENINKTKRIKE